MASPSRPRDDQGLFFMRELITRMEEGHLAVQHINSTVSPNENYRVDIGLVGFGSDILDARGNILEVLSLPRPRAVTTGDRTLSVDELEFMVELIENLERARQRYEEYMKQFRDRPRLEDPRGEEVMHASTLAKEVWRLAAELGKLVRGESMEKAGDHARARRDRDRGGDDACAGGERKAPRAGRGRRLGLFVDVHDVIEDTRYREAKIEHDLERQPLAGGIGPEVPAPGGDPGIDEGT